MLQLQGQPQYPFQPLPTYPYQPLQLQPQASYQHQPIPTQFGSEHPFPISQTVQLHYSQPTLVPDVVGPKLKDLTQALKSLPWSDVSNMAIQLEVPYNAIQDIEQRYHDPSCRLPAIMHKWLTSDPKASWKKIVKSLKDIGKSVLAKEIEQSRVLTGDEH